jgi:membrane protease YdiL (CAAX protease family)
MKDENGEQPLFPGFKQAVLLVLAVIAIQFGVSIVMAIIGVAIGVPLTEHPAVLAVINLAAFGAVLAGGVIWSRGKLGDLFPLRPMEKRLIVPILITVPGLGILLSELDNGFRYFIPPPEWVTEFYLNLTRGGSGLWASVLALVIVAPVTEELLFRGMILRGFLSRYSVRFAVIASSVLFGLMHLIPWQIIAPTFLGLLLAWWMVRTGSLWPCLIGHALNNGLVLSYSFLPFEIRGFNLMDPTADVQFHPLWLDLIGVLLLAGGLILFQRWTVPAGKDPGTCGDSDQGEKA